MSEYDFDIDTHPDDDEAYDGPDAYLEGDDNVLELEIDQDDIHIPAHPQDPSRIAISQILRCKCITAYLSRQSLLMSHLLALFDLQHLQPGSTIERTTSSSMDDNGGESMSYGDLVRLLRTAPSRAQDEEDAGNDDEDDSASSHWNRQWYPPHTEPQKRGVELLMSGEFGRVGNKLRSKKCSRNVSRLLLDRSCKSRGVLSREELSSVRSI